MKPTIELIRTSLWKMYYRIFYKQNYSQKLYSAMCITSNVIDSTNGRISHFYNTNGERVRGWHKHIKFNDTLNFHPLVRRYR